MSVLLGLLAAAFAGCTRTPASAVPTPPSSEVLAKSGFVDPAIPRITAEDLKLRLDRKQPPIIIDNRSEDEYKKAHLSGAINIPYAIGSPYPDAEEEMDRQLAALPDDALKVFYCD